MDKVEGPDPRISALGAGFLKPAAPKTPSKAAAKGARGRFRSLFSRDEGSRGIEEGGPGPSGLEGVDEGQALSELLDAVTVAGEELKADPGIAQVMAYKDAVRRFMAKVVRDSYRTEERATGSGFKKRKKYTIVRIIDAKLESLAAEILRRQRDQLEILRRLDEIRGLLVDLIR
jgi:hypothetical protein